jgi:hypothetical protein
MAHYDIFRHHLLNKVPAYGHALWDPNSVGKVRFGPVLSQLSLNAEPDPRFGSGSFPER